MIQGHFIFDGPAPVVRASVAVAGRHDATFHVEFVVDTGSTQTVIHPLDALLSLGIGLTDLENDELWAVTSEVAGVGGVASVRRAPASLTFRHVDGTLETLTIDLNLAIPDDANLGLPSLLGWDVLKHFRLEMDYASEVVRLHSNSDKTIRVP